MQGDELIDVIVEGRIGEAGPCAQTLLDEGIDAKVIMEKYLIPAMEIVGQNSIRRNTSCQRCLCPPIPWEPFWSCWSRFS